MKVKQAFLAVATAMALSCFVNPAAQAKTLPQDEVIVLKDLTPKNQPGGRDYSKPYKKKFGQIKLDKATQAFIQQTEAKLGGSFKVRAIYIDREDKVDVVRFENHALTTYDVFMREKVVACLDNDMDGGPGCEANFRRIMGWPEPDQ